MGGTGTQNPDLSFSELYKQAENSMPVLQDSGNKMLEDLRAIHPGLFDDVQFELGPLKTPERAEAKINGDYGGDHTQISDLARGRIVVDKPEQIEAIRNYLTEHADEMGVEKLKDRFAEPSPTHFRDINMKMRLPNGHLTEFRIEQRNLLEAAHHTHLLYEQAQELHRTATMQGRLMNDDEAAQYERFMDKVRDIHDEPAKKAGLDTLLNEKGNRTLHLHAETRAVRELAEEVPQASKALSLTEAFGKRAGIIGGVVVAGALTASGASASEIALGTAEATVPGVSSAVALAEGRPTEAAIRGVEEIPLAGLAASEVVRPIARATGFDVDPSIGEMLLTNKAEVSPEQKKFMEVFDGLPNKTTPDMPPEVTSLVESKRMVLEGEEKLAASYDPAARQAALKTLTAAEDHYSKQYDDLTNGGGMTTVAQWIDQKQNTPEPSQTAERQPETNTSRPVSGLIM